jgi:hypothetical protein
MYVYISLTIHNLGFVYGMTLGRSHFTSRCCRLDWYCVCTKLNSANLGQPEVQYISTRSLQNPISGSEVETCVQANTSLHTYRAYFMKFSAIRPGFKQKTYGSQVSAGTAVCPEHKSVQVFWRLTGTCVILRKHCQNIILMLKTSLHCDVGFSPDDSLVLVRTVWKVLEMSATDLRWNGKSWFQLHMEREGFAEDFVG